MQSMDDDAAFLTHTDMNRHDQHNQSSRRRSQRPENYTANVGGYTRRRLRYYAHLQSAHFCFSFFVLFPGPCRVQRQKHTVKMYGKNTETVTECWLLFGGYDETFSEEAATSMSSLKNENLIGLLGEARNSMDCLKKRETQQTASRRENLKRLRPPPSPTTSMDCLKKREPQ